MAESVWRRWRPRRGLALIVVLAVGGYLLAANLRSSPSSVKRDEVAGTVGKVVDKAIEDLKSAPPDAVVVYNAIRPPLVIIQSEQKGASGAKASSLGAGVIINDKGAILTALHVVDGAVTIRVAFVDGTQSPASVEKSDPEHDIAVLHADQLPEVVVPAVLGGGARIGDEAFAVGHPLGLIGSLSAGVISGLDRSMPLGNGRTLNGLIQFDATVNPGSSGGPLLNRNGQVIGIVTGLANATANGPSGGIGFAVPIGTAGGAAGAPAQ